MARIRALRSRTGLLRSASRLLAAGLLAYLVVRLWPLGAAAAIGLPLLYGPRRKPVGAE